MKRRGVEKDLKNIVIVGAGYAGVLTAKKLAKRLKKAKAQDQVSVTIIDRHPFHTMLTELHEVAAQRVEEDSIKISLARTFAGRRVNVVLDCITSVDYDGKTVHGENGDYRYDYLVMAAGSKPTYFGTPGAEENCFTLWSYEDAVELREHIMDTFRAAASEPDQKKRRHLLTFHVVGAGFTGVELVGEMAELFPSLCQRFEISRDDITLVNLDALSRPVPTLPEKLSDKVSRRLHKMGVKTMMGSGVCKVGEDYIEIKEGDKCVRHDAHTVVWTAGIEASDVTADAGKALENAGRGRIKCNSHLQSVSRPEVYVVGDNILFTAPGEERPVPQMVENAEQSSDLVAHNLLVEVTGKGEKEEYKPSFHGVMVCVGGRWGTARVGAGKFNVNLCSFFAMFCKHFINIVYFVQVLGWNKIFSYIKHEFFTVRNCRSFVGGHFSNRTPSFLVVPIRVWLGLVWIFEGVMKIVEGWMQTPMLTDFFGGANSFFNDILTAAGAYHIPGYQFLNTAADAVASATSAVGGAGEAVNQGVALFSYHIMGFIDATMVSAAPLAESALGDYAFKLNLLPMDWFVNTFIMPNDGVQMFMQIMIVVLEIAIGLALVGGCFTFLASAGSIVLQFMFVCTTGLYLNGIWMIFAAVAVLIGGGHVFGIDYYLIPWLKKHWKNVRWIRKAYLYHD